jgi:hypothetical protein
VIPEPDLHIPPDGPDGPVSTIIVVPYVDGMLREETMQAVHDSGEAYLTQPIDPDDPYDYAGWFRTWWKMPMDFIVIEQDMVPTPAQIKTLIEQGPDWSGIPYHVGDGRYTAGLGFCKISAALRKRWPNAGVNASLDPADSRNLIAWPSLNENVERHLTRLGERFWALSGKVEHLHYPEPAHAAR